VHSPAAVTIPLQKTADSQTTPKATNKKQTQPNKPKTHTKKIKVESDRRSSSETNDEGEVIALCQLGYWYGRTKKKREHRTTKITSSSE